MKTIKRRGRLEGKQQGAGVKEDPSGGCSCRGVPPVESHKEAGYDKWDFCNVCGTS